jgi:hypothetical protein
MDNRMTTQEIVKNSNEVKKSKQDWKKVYAVVYQSLETNKYRIFRKGNTLFWIRIDSPNVAQMYVFNADSYKNLFRNMKDFAAALRAAGYERFYGDTSDMNIINLLKRIGYSVDIEPTGENEDGKQIYRGTVYV